MLEKARVVNLETVPQRLKKEKTKQITLAGRVLIDADIVMDFIYVVSINMPFKQILISVRSGSQKIIDLKQFLLLWGNILKKEVKLR